MTPARKLVPVALLTALVGGVLYLVTSLEPPKKRRAPSDDSRSEAPGAHDAAAPPATEPEPADAPPRMMGLDARIEGGGPVTELEDDAFVPGGGAAFTLSAGIEVRASEVGRLVRAKGAAWARIPEPGADGIAHVVLPPAGPPIAIHVAEADGRPAPGVYIAYGLVGTDGRFRRVTDERGVYSIDDAPAGVLRIRVGGTERSSPALRLVVGRDREASAVLDPPLVVKGRVFSATGAPLAGARIRGLSPEGAAGSDVTSGADGSFRWVGRMNERISLVATGVGFTHAERAGLADAAVEPPLPAPRGALESAVEFRLVEKQGSIAAELKNPPGGHRDRIILSAEPAALALARETFGPEFVLDYPLIGDHPSLGMGTYEFRGLDESVPIRVMVRGDVLPEDHVLPASDGKRAVLTLSPHAAPPAAKSPAGAASAQKPAAGTASVFGRITDAEGHGLQGLTVDGGGARTTTAKDGGFRLDGLPPGEAVDLVYAWLDGADPGAAVPGEFAPWFEAKARPSATALALTLPKAAGVSLRILDGMDDRPLSWARIVVADGDGQVRFDGDVATRDGRVVLSSLVPGTPGTLSVFAPGYRRAVPIALRAGTVVDAGDVRLTRGGSVSGTVKDRRGAPLPGAVVALIDDGRSAPGPGDAARSQDLALRRTATDADGAFTLDGLDASRPAALAIWAPGFAPALHRWLFAKGTEAKLAAVLSRGGRFVLRVVDPAGAPVSGAVLDLVDARTGARRLSLVHAAVLGGSLGSSEDVRHASEFLLAEDIARPGTYRVGPVEPGPYDVIVERPGYKTIRRPFNVPESVSVELKGSVEDKNTVGRFKIESLDWEVEMEPLAPDGH